MGREGRGKMGRWESEKVSGANGGRISLSCREKSGFNAEDAEDAEER